MKDTGTLHTKFGLNKTLKKGIVGLCLTTMIFSTSGCAKINEAISNGHETIDVVMWNTYGDRFPEASGVYLMEYAAKDFEEKTGVEVNLITIDAKNQDEFFQKRDALIASEDQPDMILFNTKCVDELHQIESMRDELLPLEGIIDNYEDIFDGMKAERYSAVSVLAYGNMLNKHLVDTLGGDSNVAFLSVQEVEQLYLKWATTKDASLNIFDYAILGELGLSNMICLAEEGLQLDKTQLVDKIKTTRSFVQSLPQRAISKEEVFSFTENQNSKLYQEEVQTYVNVANQRPVNYLTKASFNAFDLQDFASHITEYESGFVVSDYSISTAIGFGILNHLSDAQKNAIEFANRLLSSDFQSYLKDYLPVTLKMSGTVLKSVHEEQYQNALNKKLTVNGAAIPETVASAYKQLGDQLNQPNSLQRMAMSTVYGDAVENVMNLMTESIWGEPMSDDALSEALNQIEVDAKNSLNE